MSYRGYNMDTYFVTDSNCVQCGRCVKACNEDGEQFLGGIRDNCPYQKYDYVPCYHCTDSFNKPAPCQEVCYYNSITIKRY